MSNGHSAMKMIHTSSMPFCLSDSVANVMPALFW